MLRLAGLATAQTTGLYYWVFAGIYLVAADRGDTANLVVAENWASYHSQVVLSSLVALCMLEWLPSGLSAWRPGSIPVHRKSRRSCLWERACSPASQPQRP